jgi:hypothetical protein
MAASIALIFLRGVRMSGDSPSCEDNARSGVERRVVCGEDGSPIVKIDPLYKSYVMANFIPQ